MKTRSDKKETLLLDFRIPFHLHLFTDVIQYGEVLKTQNIKKPGFFFDSKDDKLINVLNIANDSDHIDPSTLVDLMEEKFLSEYDRDIALQNIMYYEQGRWRTGELEDNAVSDHNASLLIDNPKDHQIVVLGRYAYHIFQLIIERREQIEKQNASITSSQQSTTSRISHSLSSSSSHIQSQQATPEEDAKKRPFEQSPSPDPMDNISAAQPLLSDSPPHFSDSSPDPKRKRYHSPTLN